jgi:ribosomal protein L37AE/L43A
MMYLIGKRRCPNCGVKGKIWRRKPDVFVCPNCNTFFSEFGIVLELFKKEEDVPT